jgi:HipA-like protein
MKPNKLFVYFETKKGRTFVGTLKREDDQYFFEYDEKYFYSENPIQVGPGLSLEKRKHHSKELFDIFLDRIPIRKNAAYEDYCKQVGIDFDESDKMILLATLGAKGPSSFVIEKEVISNFTRENLKEFRSDLDLSMREFSELFDISVSSVQKIENKHVSGKEVLKRIEIYSKFPDVAMFEVERNKKGVHSDCFYNTMKMLKLRKKS